MPDAYGMPTPEERLAIQLARANTMGRPPMMSPNTAGTITPEQMRMAAQDTQPQQAQVASLQDYGRQLMQAPSPEGIQAGNVYVAAPWTKQLAQAVRQGTGAYAAYKGGQKQKALNEEQAAINAAKGDVAVGQYADQRGDVAFSQGVEQTKLGQTDAQLAETAANNRAQRLHQAATLAQDASQFKQQFGLDQASQKGVEYVNSKGQTVNTVGMPGGGRGYFNPQSGAVERLDETQWRPLGDLVASKREDLEVTPEFNPDSMPGKTVAPSIYSRIITSDVLDEKTGIDSLDRWISATGLDVEGADLQRDMSSVMVQGVSQNLEQMEAKPVSDYETRLAGLPVPTPNTKAYGWVGWGANTYRPAAKNEMDLAIQETRASGNEEKALRQEAIRDQIMLGVDVDTIRGAIRHKYPLDKLVKAGIDPELIELIQLEEEAKK